MVNIVHRARERLKGEVKPEERRELASASFLLMGLPYPPEVAVQLWRGVQAMEESSTYQYVIEKGRKAALKDNLRRPGARRFGAPTAPTVAALNAIDDLARLDRMFDRALDAADWNDLLATP